MDKVALITGAAAGIGAAISRRLAKDGVAIGVLDLTEERAAKTVTDVEAAGGKALALGADISDRAQVTAAAGRLRDAFGPINILVNNAGITGFVPFLELTDEEWDTMLRINLKGTFIVTQVVIPDMIAANWGRIINISSSSAQSGAAKMAHYSSSKGGMIAFTRSWRRSSANTASPATPFRRGSSTIRRCPSHRSSETICVSAFKQWSKAVQSDVMVSLRTSPAPLHGSPLTRRAMSRDRSSA
jgi:NAD(P)-dependent dehydrogenase (short-subunit alcohol dehydrogenase family)